MPKKIKEFIVTLSQGIEEADAMPVPNYNDKFFYTKETDETGNIIYSIYHKPTGIIICSSRSLKKAIADLKNKIVTLDILNDKSESYGKLFSIRLCLYNRAYVRITMSTGKSEISSIIALSKENIPQLTPDDVNTTLENIIFKHRKNNNKCGILSLEFYSSLEDAVSKTNCVYSINYDSHNSFVFENLYFGYNFSA